MWWQEILRILYNNQLKIYIYHHIYLNCLWLGTCWNVGSSCQRREQRCGRRCFCCCPSTPRWMHFSRLDLLLNAYFYFTIQTLMDFSLATAFPRTFVQSACNMKNNQSKDLWEVCQFFAEKYGETWAYVSPYKKATMTKRPSWQPTILLLLQTKQKWTPLVECTIV